MTGERARCGAHALAHGCSDAPHTPSVRPFRPVTAQAVAVAVTSTNIAVEPLIPPPPLPAAGMCRPGVPIADSSMRTLLAPTDAAWALFFARLGVSKAAVFADVPFLLSLLDYLELDVVGLDRPYSPDGANAGSRYFAYDLFRGQILRTVINPAFLPVGTPVNVFNMLVDVRPLAGTLRAVAITGQPVLATEADNVANILAPDIIACDGLLHVVDAVLIPPTLTTFQQISFRPELSLFRQLLLSPGLEAVRRSLGIEGVSCGAAHAATPGGSALSDAGASRIPNPSRRGGRRVPAPRGRGGVGAHGRGAADGAGVPGAQ